MPLGNLAVTTWRVGAVYRLARRRHQALPEYSAFSPRFSSAGCCRCSTLRRLSARVLPSVVGPAENTTPLHFRLGSRCRRLSGLGLRRWRGWRRQIVALHRIDKFAFRGLANRGADIDTPGRALRRWFGLTPGRGRNQEKGQQEFLHRLGSRENGSAGRSLLQLSSGGC
jgi:hypothetical protein